MKRPTGFITDDIHVDITNTSLASSTDENQEPALILTPHSHHSHTATPAQSPSQPPPNQHLPLINPLPLYQPGQPPSFKPSQPPSVNQYVYLPLVYELVKLHNDTTYDFHI